MAKNLKDKIANREHVNPKEISEDIAHQMPDSKKRSPFIEIAKKEEEEGHFQEIDKNGKPASKISYIVIGVIVVLAIIALWIYRFYNPHS